MEFFFQFIILGVVVIELLKLASSFDYLLDVFVEAEKFAGKDTKLVIIPNPLRIILSISPDKQQVVWEGK